MATNGDIRVIHPDLASIYWSWISMTGPDARDFLQRLSTVDMKALEPGRGAEGFLLNEKGRARAHFHLWCYGPEEFAFEFDAGVTGHWKESLLQTIDRYTFAEDFALTDVSGSHDGLECRWVFTGAALEDLLPMTTGVSEEEIRICHHGTRHFGRNWYSAWGRPARLMKWVDDHFSGAGQADAATLERWRVQALAAWEDREISSEIMPVEVGLGHTIGEAKGCYPGQEVIEKIFSYGSPPKRLVRLSGKGTPPAAGAPVFGDPESAREVGQLTSISSGEDGFSALAIIKKVHAREGSALNIDDPIHGTRTEATVEKVAPYERA